MPRRTSALPARHLGGAHWAAPNQLSVLLSRRWLYGMLLCFPHPGKQVFNQRVSQAMLWVYLRAALLLRVYGPFAVAGEAWCFFRRKQSRRLSRARVLGATPGEGFLAGSVRFVPGGVRAS